jgi:hypothetical protein
MSQDYDHRSQGSFSRRPSMTLALPPQESRYQRIRRRACRLLAWCVSLGVVAFCLANLATSWLLHRELAAVVQRGEPLRLGELVPAALPESQNAALVYLRAAESLTLSRAEEEQLRNNQDILSAVDALARNQAAITLTRQATTIPTCRFPVDYDATNLAGILLPHLGKMRSLADVVSAQALREARLGQTDAALNDIAVLFRMSEHLAPEPILLSGVTAIAIERLGYKTLARVLDDVALSPDQAQGFAGRLAHTDWTDALHNDLLGERCFGLWAFQFASNPIEARQLVRGPYASGSTIVSKGLGVLWSPLWKMDEVQYLRARDRQSKAFLKPGTPLISDDKFVRELPWYAICTRIMLPALARVGYKRDAVLVYRRMALVALALHACRTTQGHFPDSLHDAEKNWRDPLPHDLYTEQSFLYRREGAKILLYSVGPNRKDEGGRKAERTGSRGADISAGDDLVW